MSIADGMNVVVNEREEAVDRAEEQPKSVDVSDKEVINAVMTFDKVISYERTLVTAN